MRSNSGNKKLRQSAIDHLLVGVSPAFIIGMIASLSFFLVAAFYRGQYDLRLMYILGLYTVAIVLIARIAIESGRQHAHLFSLPLAIATLLATLRFVPMSSTLGSFGVVLNIGLLGLIWYLADRITFDCTLVDERERSVREGLLQSLGLVKSDSIARQHGLLHARSKNHASQPKRKSHNPGVWILYFALLALPLFGLGQLLIPDDEHRQQAFTFLLGYLGFALGLLVITSFVSTRRYLRQRNVAMPPEMAGTWLGTGILAVIGILLLCLLLPLPGRSLGFVGPPFEIAPGESLSANQWGWGSESTSEQGAGNANDDLDAPQNASSVDGKQARREGAKSGQAPQDETRKGSSISSDGKSSGSTSRRGDSADEASTAANRSSGKQSPASSSNSFERNTSSPEENGSAANSGQSGSSDDRPDDARRAENSGDTQAAQQQADADSSQQADAQASQQAGAQASQQAGAQASQQADGQAKSELQEKLDGATQSNVSSEERQSNEQDTAKENQDNNAAQQRSGNNPAANWQLPEFAIGDWIKWLIITILVAIILIYLVTHPGDIARLFRDLQRWLLRLLGGDKASRSEAITHRSGATVDSQQNLPTFKEFRDPFEDQLRGWSANTVVKHTFSALECWAREKGISRGEEQTPSEFANQLRKSVPELERLPMQAAGMLDRVMFAGWNPTTEDIQPLRKLWAALKSRR